MTPVHRAILAGRSGLAKSVENAFIRPTMWSAVVGSASSAVARAQDCRAHTVKVDGRSTADPENLVRTMVRRRP